MDQAKVGKFISVLRKERGLTQEALGEKLGVTEPGTGERIAGVLKKYGMPTEPGFAMEEIVAATALDKKSDGDTLRFILIPRIGESLIRPVTRRELLEALS